MHSAPESYGRLIASRYWGCAHPLAGGISGAYPGAGPACGISGADLACIADCVSQGRELDRNARDGHGRLDEEQAVHGRGAAVDDLLAGLAAPCPGRRFSVIVTHDVDRTTLLECTAAAKFFAGGRSPWAAISTLRASRSAIAGLVDELLRFEADNGIRSIFFFLSGPYSLSRYGSRTSARWASAQAIIRAVQAAGMEIGLHGSYYARDKASYADECRRLADVAQVSIRHHRNHYLRYEPASFWRQLSEAGIGFDHSAGFVNGWGLRTGTCVPYPAYDITAGAVSGVIEIPMLLMDGDWALQFNRSHRDSIRSLLETVRSHRGCVGINFHPEPLATNRAVWDCFSQVIALCHELGADMRLPL